MIRITGVQDKNDKGGVEVISDLMNQYIVQKYKDKNMQVCMWPPLCVLEIIKSIFTKERIVCYEHFDIKYISLKWIILRYIFYRFAYKVVCISQSQYLYFERFIDKQRLVKIYNPVVIDEEHKNIKKQNRILYVGHLRKLKQVDVLIDEVNKIKEQMRKSNWVLDIVGNGEEYDSLRNLVNEYELDDIVNFHGYQKNTALFYNRSSIFVLPSKSEGVPLVLLEAMRSNSIVISQYYSSSIYELIENNKSGFIYYDNNNLSTLLMLVMDLYDNKSSLLDEISSEGYKTLKDRSLDNFLGKWRKIIEDK